VFIVGHLRGTSRPEVFPIGGTNSQDIEQINKPKHSNDRVYGTNGISPTLNTMQGGNRQPFISTPQIRKLTPTECERLQGFPDGWTEGISNSQRYKTLGNAVTVNVVRAVINNLITNQIKICGKKNLINSLIWIIMVKAIVQNQFIILLDTQKKEYEDTIMEIEKIHQEEIIKFLDAMDKQKQEITDHVIKLSAHQSNYDQLKTMSKAERIPLKPKNNKKLKEYSEAVEKGIDIQLEKLLDFYWQLSPWNKQDRLPAVIKAIKKLMK
jgi:hypothetical protein